MRKIIILILLAVFCLVDVAVAQMHGVIQGQIVDSDGQGLIGATVMVIGTDRGANVRESNGGFTIANIVAGTYDVRIRYVGKREVIVNDVVVSTNLTTNIGRIVLPDEGIETEVVVVDAQREMVRKDQIGSQRIIDGTNLATGTTSSLAATVSQTAGVRQSGGGISIRGSRPSETKILVDGMQVNSQFTGDLGISGIGYLPTVSNWATSETQVMTGGFSAEYGNVMGGVINQTVDPGRTDRYDMFLRYNTDIAPLWGSHDSGLEVYREGTVLKARDVGKGNKLQGNNVHQVDFNVGGPIPLINNATFRLVTDYTDESNRTTGTSYEYRDPFGNNLGNLPNRGLWKKNITGRLSFNPVSNIKILFGGGYGLTSYENRSWAWLYANQPGYYRDANGNYTVSNGIPENIAKENVGNQTVISGFAKLNHTLSSSSFYELQIAWNANNEEIGRRIGWDDPNYFTGFDILKPQDIWVASQSEPGTLTGGEANPMRDRQIDHYQEVKMYRATEDGYINGVYPVRNPLTGYFEGNYNTSGTRNAYGIRDFFYTSGNSTPIMYNSGSYWQIKGDYTNLFSTGDFNHSLKAGLDLRIHELHRLYIGNPYTSNPWYDIYTDKWGGNLYTDDPEVKNMTETPYNPFEIGVYIQDQISYKGIILSAGIRFDYFDPNSYYRTYSDRFVQINADSGFANTTSKFLVSPRINIAYPITERSVLSLNYGVYMQIPAFQRMFNAFATEVLRPGSTLGNPQIDAQRTNTYQIDYEHQLTDDFKLRISTFYKDIYNQDGVRFISAVPIAFWEYVVSEYGNSKGIEIDLNLRPVKNIGFDFNYSLATLTGTSTNPDDNTNKPIDPYTNLITFPLAEYYLGRDVRHSISSTLRYIFRKGEGPSIGGIKLLQNTNLSVTGNFSTGTPYTRTDPQGNPISELNAERHPSNWVINSRISRIIPIRDIFGDTFGNSQFEIFVDILNLTNRTAATSYFGSSGDPIDNGVWLARLPGSFSSVVYYKEADYSNPATFSPLQYDNFGYRMYNEMADFDGNGAVTQSEKYESYINYVTNVLEGRGNFQIPRRIFAGFIFRF